MTQKTLNQQKAKAQEKNITLDQDALPPHLDGMTCMSTRMIHGFLATCDLEPGHQEADGTRHRTHRDGDDGAEWGRPRPVAVDDQDGDQE